MKALKKGRTKKDYIKDLEQAYRYLQLENASKTAQCELLNNIASLVQMQLQLIGLDQMAGIYVATVISPHRKGSTLRNVFLCQLPIGAAYMFESICSLDLKYIRCPHGYTTEKKIAYIDDWRSHIQDQGFGSCLMRHLIQFLSASGFDFLDGIISYVDFDHLEKLLHFYKKFGFEVLAQEDHYKLRLDLQAIDFSKSPFSSGV